eukprot:SM006127S20104  [mRNA]  locus=s6127:17:629:- [translate_table: standard]
MTTALGTSAPLGADDLVCVAGASAAVELLAMAIADPGDGFIVPAPYYPGFTVDLGSRSGVELLPAASEAADRFA